MLQNLENVQFYFASTHRAGLRCERSTFRVVWKHKKHAIMASENMYITCCMQHNWAHAHGKHVRMLYSGELHVQHCNHHIITGIRIQTRRDCGETRCRVSTHNRRIIMDLCVCDCVSFRAAQEKCPKQARVSTINATTTSANIGGFWALFEHVLSQQSFYTTTNTNKYVLHTGPVDRFIQNTVVTIRQLY